MKLSFAVVFLFNHDSIVTPICERRPMSVVQRAVYSIDVIFFKCLTVLGNGLDINLHARKILV